MDSCWIIALCSSLWHAATKKINFVYLEKITNAKFSPISISIISLHRTGEDHPIWWPPTVELHISRCMVMLYVSNMETPKKSEFNISSKIHFKIFVLFYNYLRLIVSCTLQYNIKAWQINLLKAIFANFVVSK